MRRRTLLLALGALPACTTLTPPAAPPGRDPNESWARILRDRVDDEGRVDFVGLSRDPTDLDAYVAFIARTDWRDIPDPDARLATLINAYNALAMHNVLRHGIPTRLTLLGRFGFFKATELIVGNRPISLYDLENDVIRPIGEERIHVALNCMVVSCPRLPRTPFTGPNLDRELDAASREFFNSPKHVRVDDAARTLRVSAILDFYTRDFLAKAPTLAAYVNRYRTTPAPADYRVAFLDYDWTINRWP